jgi:hypothetical protein
MRAVELRQRLDGRRVSGEGVKAIRAVRDDDVRRSPLLVVRKLVALLEHGRALPKRRQRPLGPARRRLGTAGRRRRHGRRPTSVSGRASRLRAGCRGARLDLCGEADALGGEGVPAGLKLPPLLVRLDGLQPRPDPAQLVLGLVPPHLQLFEFVVATPGSYRAGRARPVSG